MLRLSTESLMILQSSPPLPTGDDLNHYYRSQIHSLEQHEMVAAVSIQGWQAVITLHLADVDRRLTTAAQLCRDAAGAAGVELQAGEDTLLLSASASDTREDIEHMVCIVRFALDETLGAISGEDQ